MGEVFPIYDQLGDSSEAACWPLPTSDQRWVFIRLIDIMDNAVANISNVVLLVLLGSIHPFTIETRSLLLHTRIVSVSEYLFGQIVSPSRSDWNVIFKVLCFLSSHWHVLYAGHLSNIKTLIARECRWILLHLSIEQAAACMGVGN